MDRGQAGRRSARADELPRAEREGSQRMLELALHRLDQERRRVGRDRVAVEEPFPQPDRSEGKAEPPLHPGGAALDPFGAAAADVEDEEILSAPVGIGLHAEEDRLGLLRAGEEPDRKPEHAPRLPEEFAAVAAVADRAGGHGPEPLRPELFRLGPEEPQGVERPRHRLGPQLAGVDQVLGQPRADAFLAQDAEPAAPVSATMNLIELLPRSKMA